MSLKYEPCAEFNEECADMLETLGEYKKPGWYFPREREFFIDNLLVRIHLIIEIILVDRPCAKGV